MYRFAHAIIGLIWHVARIRASDVRRQKILMTP